MTIPGDALAGAEDVTTLTVTSSLSDAVSDAVTYTTTANQVADLSLTTAAPQSAEPGTAVTYTHQLQNLGNGVDTFVVTAVSNQGWPVTVSVNPTLDPGEATTVVVVMHLPAGIAANTVNVTTLTVRSGFDNSVMKAVTETTTAVQGGHAVYLPMVSRP